MSKWVAYTDGAFDVGFGEVAEIGLHQQAGCRGRLDLEPHAGRLGQIDRGAVPQFEGQRYLVLPLQTLEVACEVLFEHRIATGVAMDRDRSIKIERFPTLKTC